MLLLLPSQVAEALLHLQRPASNGLVAPTPEGGASVEMAQ